jgi:hypothetical protein
MDFKIADVSVYELKPHPRNYKEHPEDQVSHIAKSIQDFGFYRNIVVSQDGFILAGHGVVESAKKLEVEKVPVLVVPLNHDDIKALKILTGDNEIGRLADVEVKTLSQLMKDLSEDEQLFGTGFDASMVSILEMVAQESSDLNKFNPADEWDIGMPEYEALPHPTQLTVMFEDANDVESFLAFIKIKTISSRGNTISCRYPEGGRDDLVSIRFDTE